MLVVIPITGIGKTDILCFLYLGNKGGVAIVGDIALIKLSLQLMNLTKISPVLSKLGDSLFHVVKLRLKTFL